MILRKEGVKGRVKRIAGVRERDEGRPEDLGRKEEREMK